MMIKNRVHYILGLGLFLPFTIGASGCPNAFQSFANTKTDDALYFQAEQDADAKDWTDAIASIQAMSAAAQAEISTKTLLASLYAGRCGLDVVQLANSVANTSTSTSLFPILKTAFSSVTVSQKADCLTAEQTMLGAFTNLSDLTPDENVELAFIEFSNIGAILASYGIDPSNQENTSGYGTFNCSTISNADAEEIALGMVVAVNALTQAGSTVGSSATTAFSSICTYLTSHGAPSTICSAPFAASNFSGEVTVIQEMVKGSDLGWDGGSCGSVTSGGCTCP